MGINRDRHPWAHSFTGDEDYGHNRRRATAQGQIQKQHKTIGHSEASRAQDNKKLVSEKANYPETLASSVSNPLSQPRWAYQRNNQHKACARTGLFA